MLSTQKALANAVGMTLDEIAQQTKDDTCHEIRKTALRYFMRTLVENYDTLTLRVIYSTLQTSYRDLGGSLNKAVRLYHEDRHLTLPVHGADWVATALTMIFIGHGTENKIIDPRTKMSLHQFCRQIAETETKKTRHYYYDTRIREFSEEDEMYIHYRTKEDEIYRQAIANGHPLTFNESQEWDFNG